MYLTPTALYSLYSVIAALSLGILFSAYILNIKKLERNRGKYLYCALMVALAFILIVDTICVVFQNVKDTPFIELQNTFNVLYYVTDSIIPVLFLLFVLEKIGLLGYLKLWA